MLLLLPFTILSSVIVCGFFLLEKHAHDTEEAGREVGMGKRERKKSLSLSDGMKLITRVITANSRDRIKIKFSVLGG